MDGSLAGTMRQDRAGELTLAYERAWLSSEAARPLSVSMPLGQCPRGGRLDAFLRGLLPDDERVLARCSRTHHASAPYRLLGHVGEDCAGAVQFVAPDRVEARLARNGGVTWISETSTCASRPRPPPRLRGRPAHPAPRRSSSLPVLCRSSEAGSARVRSQLGTVVAVGDCRSVGLGVRFEILVSKRVLSTPTCQDLQERAPGLS
ncbi:HipA N-terminal domain-containing protein [Phytohabitans houttuyneae]|uniref:HipA N-terminal domain-containing protein n=1 Tax=Phytohabitans houttuyneae TaxID=1076126 RepID=UPI003CD094EA